MLRSNYFDKQNLMTEKSATADKNRYFKCPSITSSHVELDSLSIKACELKEEMMNFFFHLVY